MHQRKKILAMVAINNIRSTSIFILGGVTDDGVAVVTIDETGPARSYGFRGGLVGCNGHRVLILENEDISGQEGSLEVTCAPFKGPAIGNSQNYQV